MAGGWLGVALARLHPLSYQAAGVLLVKTVVFGAALRAIVATDDTPPAFVAVAAAVLGALLFGWRTLARRGVQGLTGVDQVWRAAPNPLSGPE